MTQLFRCHFQLIAALGPTVDMGLGTSCVTLYRLFLQLYSVCYCFMDTMADAHLVVSSSILECLPECLLCRMDAVTGGLLPQNTA